jgi:isopentenyl-diphosphate delta-isomerase
MTIEQRKKDHVDLCVDGDVAYSKSAGFERFDFVHNALSEVNLDEIRTDVNLFKRTFSFPLFVSSMTGGYARAEAVNAIIARFCEKNNLPFGVGSQRVMLEKPESVESFSVVRKEAPTAFIAGNIGGCQLINSLTDKQLSLLTDTIKADACIVHLNPLQELMQPEGDRHFKGVLSGIEHLVKQLHIPVIVKETGAGISCEVAFKLMDAGVAAIDVAGAGGTSWSKVENQRSGITKSPFDDWGIPTVDCLLQLEHEVSTSIPVIASGGVRTAFDIAKSLCLGAKTTAMAQPVIKAIIENGEDGLDEWYNQLVREFKIIMCLLGVDHSQDLKRKHLVEKK